MADIIACDSIVIQSAHVNLDVAADVYERHVAPPGVQRNDDCKTRTGCRRLQWSSQEKLPGTKQPVAGLKIRCRKRKRYIYMNYYAVLYYKTQRMIKKDKWSAFIIQSRMKYKSHKDSSRSVFAEISGGNLP